MDTAWNIIRRMAAHTASCIPTPAQAVISPRLDIVEYARTFFPSSWEIASMEVTRKVKPPIVVTIVPARLPSMAGARRISRYTPALTIVAECRSALVGVGATIAPRSQPEKGSCALLVSPANARKTTGINASPAFASELTARATRS